MPHPRSQLVVGGIHMLSSFVQYLRGPPIRMPFFPNYSPHLTRESRSGRDKVTDDLHIDGGLHLLESAHSFFKTFYARDED